MLCIIYTGKGSFIGPSFFLFVWFPQHVIAAHLYRCINRWLTTTGSVCVCLIIKIAIMKFEIDPFPFIFSVLSSDSQSPWNLPSASSILHINRIFNGQFSSEQLGTHYRFQHLVKGNCGDWIRIVMTLFLALGYVSSSFPKLIKGGTHSNTWAWNELPLGGAGTSFKPILFLFMNTPQNSAGTCTCRTNVFSRPPPSCLFFHVQNRFSLLGIGSAWKTWKFVSLNHIVRHAFDYSYYMTCLLPVVANQFFS